MRRSAVTLALVLATQTAAAQTSAYRVVRKPRMAMAFAGAGFLLGGYALSVITTFTPAARGEAWTAAPLVGPWVALARGTQQPLDDLTFVAQGLFQAAGAILLAVGLVPREVHVQQTIIVFTPSGIEMRF